MPEAQRVNIPKSVKDEHYRYKRDLTQIKIEGRGNGIKTLVTNMKQIANQLKVPIEYPTKYFGLELGAQTKVKGDSSLINGRYDHKVIEEVLENFIQKFILCENCKYPELDYTIKHKEIQISCKACGHQGKITQSEKLYNTIMKVPPYSKGFPSSQDSQKQQQQQKKGGSSSSSLELVSTPEKIDIDDGTWTLDTSAEAIRKRREEEGLSEKFRALTKGPEEEEEKVEEESEEQTSPVSILKKFIELRGEDQLDTKQIYQAIKKLKEDYELTKKDCICLIYETFLNPETVSRDRIAQIAPLFQAFMSEGSTGSQRIILGYTEELVGVKEPSLLSKTSGFLYEFYRQGLLTKEVVDEWITKKKSKFVKDSKAIAKVKEAAKPFGEYLQSAA